MPVAILSIMRALPPSVAQTRRDSCWAAVLESWTRVAKHLPPRGQAELIARWGEGQTGGITPWIKIPLIAADLGLQHGGIAPRDALQYIHRHIGGSYIFCAHAAGAFSHAQLIYGYDDEAKQVQIMDPAGGRYLVRDFAWFEQQPAGLVMMRH